jgi:hypothetical protein
VKAALALVQHFTGVHQCSTPPKFQVPIDDTDATAPDYLVCTAKPAFECNRLVYHANATLVWFDCAGMKYDLPQRQRVNGKDSVKITARGHPKRNG